MTRNTDIAIIGAGTAGLSALREIKKTNKDYLLIDPGPFGTTCARVGCMPSKVLIHCANEFHHRHKLGAFGIDGGEALRVSIPKVLERVRSMRDYFTSGVVQATLANAERLIQGRVRFKSPNELLVGDERISAKKIIIATGTKNVILDSWQAFVDRVLTSDTLFEQLDLPDKMAVIGAGVIGLELGQALSRLGIEVTQFHAHAMLAELTDPDINQAAVEIFSKEHSLVMSSRADVVQEGDALTVSGPDASLKVSKILASIGRRPHHLDLNLECLNVPLDKFGIPCFDSSTMQVGDTPVFIAGDATTTRPLLHEAADEGRIAGFNATLDEPICFKRRTPMTVIFTDPNIALVGARYQELKDRGQDFVMGEVNFDDQGRSKIMQVNLGKLHVYADANDGKLLGAEMIAPAGEHLAHLLAWAIQQELNVFEVLKMPYYHPVIEEGMRTAIRACAKQIKNQEQGISEIALCRSSAVLGR